MRELIPVPQPPNTGICGQCVVAMLTGRPIEDIISVFEHQKRSGTHWREVFNVLWYYGCRFYFDSVKGEPPCDGNVYIVVVGFRGVYKSHWAVWKDGNIYCSCNGIYPFIKGYERIVKHYKMIGYVKI